MSAKRSRLDEGIIEDEEKDGEQRVELELDNPVQSVPEEEIQLAKKKRVARKQIKEADIAGPDGIQRIYDAFPKLCRFHGRGNEVNA